MSLWDAIVNVTLVSASAMALLWVWQVIKNDASVIDVAWAYGMAMMAFYLMIIGEGDLLRRLLMLAMVGLWAARLGTYLLKSRVLRPGSEEDGRYQRMRASMGKLAHPGFFLFFQAQALFIVMFVIPLWGVISNESPVWRIWELLAIAVWLFAIGGESLADRQLDAFRSSPENQGKTCQTGLWKYSRHPNYFFEWLHWFAYPLLAWGSPYFLLTLLAPAFMFVFLTKLTGIPYTEQQAASRREDYTAYQRATNMFFPGPRKSAE